MNIADIIAGAYVAFGAWRGRARGLADEGYRLLRLGVAFAAGCGLYGVVSGLLKHAISMAGDVSAPVAFAGTVGGTWWLLSALKKKVIAVLAARFAPYAQIGGAVAGGVRTLLLVLSIVGVFHLAGRAPGRDTVVGTSMIGQLAAWVMPGK